MFEFRKGPVFANIVLADEINRATPKTQSALLEAMQEHRVTVGKRTHVLDEPFVVLATQNPLEMEGTYPLPEAQLDRFFFKLHVAVPGARGAARDPRPARPAPGVERRSAVLDRERHPRRCSSSCARCPSRGTCRTTPSASSRRRTPTGPTRRTSRSASSATAARRAARRRVLLAAKIRALFDGRFAASVDDVRACAHPALRHRVLLNFEGEAEGIKTDQVHRRDPQGACPRARPRRRAAAGAN